MMRHLLLFALIGCCFLATGCCSTGGCCRWFGCEAEDDEYCGCCTDGSESPRYKPPGPWWTRPDCGCPGKCRTYHEARRSVCEEARYLQLQNATMAGVHSHVTTGQY